MMKSRCLLVALIAVAGASHADAQQKIARGRATTPTVSIRFVAAVGNIQVIGWDRDSMDVVGVIPTGARMEFFGGAPGEHAAGMKMYIEAPTDASGREGRITMHLPRGARLWLKTGSADIDVTGVTGGLDLNVVGGSITVHGNPSELRAESMDGNVVVDGSPDWLRAKTATGDITMHGGTDVGASTISGTVRTTGGTVEKAKLESTTGAIAFASGLIRGASVELETHSGPIDVFFQPQSSAELDAATITGAIDNQWTNARPVSGSEGRGMTLVTSSGVGGGKIVVRSFKGTVQLRRK